MNTPFVLNYVTLFLSTTCLSILKIHGILTLDLQPRFFGFVDLTANAMILII